MTVLDAHVHLWDTERMTLSWFRDEMGLPRRADLSQVSSPVIAVQAADTLAEATWLVHQAEQHHQVRAVVLQYDPRPGSWAGMAQPLIAADPVAGIRLAAADRSADLSDVSGLEQLAAGLAASGQVLELLLRPDQLAAAAALARRHPDLTTVLCHLGLGAREVEESWRTGFADLAEIGTVAVKYSGLLTADGGTRLRHLAHLAFDYFGPDRVMFGSDWPMSSRLTGYPDVLTRTRAAVGALSTTTAAAFWGGTATRLYRIGG